MADKDTAPSETESLTVGSAATLLEGLESEQSDDPKPDSKQADPDADDDAELVAQLESDDAGPGDDAETPPLEQPETREVKMPDGRVERVTFDEALRGYSREADYTQKTQATAEKDRKLEAELLVTRDARSAYQTKLAEVEKTLNETIGGEPDWNRVREEQPEQYPTLWTEYQRLKDDRKKLQAEQERIAKEEAAEQAKELEGIVSQERVKLGEAWPEWVDPEKGRAVQDDTVNDAVEHYGALGLTAADVRETKLAYPMVILGDALKYKRLEAKVRKLKTKAKAAPTAEPGAKPPSSDKATSRAKFAKAQERLRQTGRKEDALAALEALGED